MAAFRQFGYRGEAPETVHFSSFILDAAVHYLTIMITSVPLEIKAAAARPLFKSNRAFLPLDATAHRLRPQAPPLERNGWSILDALLLVQWYNNSCINVVYKSNTDEVKCVTCLNCELCFENWRKSRDLIYEQCFLCAGC